MAKTLVSFVCALVACSPPLARAQSYEGVGIRAQGMAGAFVAVADDATASWWNPAGLATSAVVCRRSLSKAGQGGHWGVALRISVPWPELLPPQYQPNTAIWLYRARRLKPTRSRSCRNRSACAGLHGLSISLAPRWASRSAATWLWPRRSSWCTSCRTRRAASTSARWRRFGPLRLGVTVRDVTSGTFESDTGTLRTGAASARRRGVCWCRPAGGSIGLTIAFDADLTEAPINGRDERQVAGGAEAWMLGRRLGLRGGLGAAISDDPDGDGLFGAFGVSVSPYQRVYVGGAITRGADAERNRWGFDLRVTF